MAPVKLTIVALFLCILTFTKIVPTIAGIHEVESEIVRLYEDRTKWYVVAKAITAAFYHLYPLENEFVCTPKTVRFSLNEKRLLLKIENEVFSCNCEYPDREPKIWECKDPFSSSNGENKKRNDAKLELKNNGDIEIRYFQRGLTHVDYISLPGKWDRELLRMYGGMKFAKSTDC